MVIATQTGWIPVRAGVFRFSVAEAWPWTTVSFNALASVGTAVAASSLAGVARHALGRFRELERDLRELNEDLERRIEVAVAALRSTNASLAARNEDLGRTLRHVGLFARAVSHDLRNPVTAGGEFLRLARSADGASKERFLSLAAENLLRADRMLIGLRDLMRAMGSPRREEPIDVRGVVEDVIAELRAASGGEAPPVCLVGQFSETSGQVEQLAHIFRNLIGNAIEHNRGRPDLHVEVGQDGDANEPSFFVRDNGIGVSNEIQGRIFEPFHRGPSSSGDGLGLGLALVEAIVSNAG
jgi:signal transduction histidine kinase